MAKITTKKNDEEKVRCPYCDEEITELIEKTVKRLGSSLMTVTSKSIYACGKCKKILPVSHSTYAF